MDGPPFALCWIEREVSHLDFTRVSDANPWARNAFHVTFSPWRDRNLALHLCGQTISLVGTAAGTLSLRSLKPL